MMSDGGRGCEGEYDTYVMRLPVVAVSCSPPVSLDKTRYFIYDSTPLTLVTLQLLVFLGSSTAENGAPETNDFTLFSYCRECKIY